MAYNSTTTLTGNIGGEIRFYEGTEKKSFATFRLATADSYQDEQENWVQKETEWHTIKVFSPYLISQLKSLQHNARIKITGKNDYEEFQALLEDGRVVKKNHCSVIAKKLEMATLVPRQAA